jgi:hypothetical protein
LEIAAGELSVPSTDQFIPDNQGKLGGPEVQLKQIPVLREEPLREQITFRKCPYVKNLLLNKA